MGVTAFFSGCTHCIMYMPYFRSNGSNRFFLGLHTLCIMYMPYIGNDKVCRSMFCRIIVLKRLSEIRYRIIVYIELVMLRFVENLIFSYVIVFKHLTLL